MQTTTGNRTFARYAWAVLAYNVAVVLWGAFVRATGSGAGCGEHWPLCNGVILPVAPTLEAIIEFTHRVTSGIDLAMVVILLVWAFRKFPARSTVRRGAVLSMGFLMVEALLGAGLVMLEKVAKDPHSVFGYWLAVHLVNTLTLLACLTLTAWWGMGKPGVRVAGRAGWMAGGSLAIVAVLGVSGVIAALGDTLFPVKSLAEAFAQDFDPAASLLIRLRVLHPMIAVVTGAWLVLYAISLARRADLRSRAWLLIALVGCQVAAGVVNLLLRAPVAMQIVHLALADALWITLVILCAGVLKQNDLSTDKMA